MYYFWLIPILLVAIGLYFRHKEIKEFNNGNCSCGGVFKAIAMDSQGGTGWSCNKCNKSMWTSWIKVCKYN